MAANKINCMSENFATYKTILLEIFCFNTNVIRNVSDIVGYYDIQMNRKI